MADSDSSVTQLSRKDFVSNQDVRWCPGCGDYAILSQIQKVLPQLGLPREKFVFVSGIGCSSRLPYYVNTYGFHSIHGRAPAIATGIKAYNSDLSVWVITGDGDALSIGGNHLIHSLRRNIDINILLLNNRIYGLTKGQYSPTSEFGKKTKSSPKGSIDYPINPIAIALGAEATFVARSIDTDMKHLEETLIAAANHRGSTFVEIFQNCIIFNDKAFGDVSDRKKRNDVTLYLEPGKPLVFGSEPKKGIRLNGWQPEVVTIGENGITEDDLMIHDPEAENHAYANIIASLEAPEFPVPVGCFRKIQRPTYDELLDQQVQEASKENEKVGLENLLYGSETWTISDKEDNE